MVKHKVITKIAAGSVQHKTATDALIGVVALVDVGAKERALALREKLTALGATVVLAWSPIVTHLVWTKGGCRSTRARARCLGCEVVSPLWVEACAASAQWVSEKKHPSSTRASDLPTPHTMRRILKRAEKENWPPLDLLLNKDDRGEERPVRLRMSTDSNETREKTDDGDTTHESVDVESRVNTAPRRALPMSMTPEPVDPKSKRRLFTAKPDGADDESDPETSPRKQTRKVKPPSRPQKGPVRPERSPKRAEKPTRVPQRKKKYYNLTQELKKNLETAEKLAKLLTKAPAKEKRINPTRIQRRKPSNIPHIVLTGMSKAEHQVVLTAVQSLNCKVQRHVNKRTTHVLLGSCKEDYITATVHEETQACHERNMNKTSPVTEKRKAGIDENGEITGVTNEDGNSGVSDKNGAKSDKNATSVDNSARGGVMVMDNGNINKRPTHVQLGSCKEGNRINTTTTVHEKTQTSHNRKMNETPKKISICIECNSHEDVLIQILEDNADRNKHCTGDPVIDEDVRIICKSYPENRKARINAKNVSIDENDEITVANNENDGNGGVSNKNVVENCAKSDENAASDKHNSKSDKNAALDDNNASGDVIIVDDVDNKRLRTLKTLLGAARGCRVLHARWALDSQREEQWVPHSGYQVPHLLNIMQKARWERSALGKMHSEYGYDVFRGMRVSVSDTADHRDAAVQLLALCGANITDHRLSAQDGGGTQNGGPDAETVTVGGKDTQYGGETQNGGSDAEIVTVGKGRDDVNSKWVFDSVVAGRPRTTRRYINRNYNL